MSKYAIIDVETTGGQASRERITEIAIVVHDGAAVIDTFSTLINPERSIPWNITQLTGITDEMVAHAPKFYEVARRIVEITEDAIFVAHNATFDYNFVREEFARLGYAYTRKQLCTVRLARKVFPGLASYSLSNLKQHFGIQTERSHRALDDTLATVKLFEYMLREQEGPQSLRTLVNHGVREAKLPPNISLDRLHRIPEDCGVYYLHNAAGEVIYVGKSLNIRKRLFEHFADMTPKGEKLRAGVNDISYEVTGSELVALLLESAEIKRLQPQVNRAQRTRTYRGALFSYLDASGYRRFIAGKPNSKECISYEMIAEYPKLENAKQHLEAVVERFQLCTKLCHLDTHENACFRHAIKKCLGACLGFEQPELYNARATQAMEALHNGLKGSFVVIEPGRSKTERAVVAVAEGQFRGYSFLEEDSAVQHPSEWFEQIKTHYPDPQAARIIRSYLTSNRRNTRIIDLSEQAQLPE